MSPFGTQRRFWGSLPTASQARFRTIQVRPKDLRALSRQPSARGKLAQRVPEGSPCSTSDDASSSRCSAARRRGRSPRAQQATKSYRIGMLETISPALNAAHLDAFREGLRQLGYVEGKNY